MNSTKFYTNGMYGHMNVLAQKKADEKSWQSGLPENKNTC